MTDQPQPPEQPATRTHLWHMTPVRDLFWIALALLAVWLIFALQAVVVPVVIAFVFAYLVDPVIRRLEDQLGWSRGFQTSAFVIVLAGFIVVALFWFVPAALMEANRLVRRAPEYMEIISERYNIAWLQEGAPADVPGEETQPTPDQSGEGEDTATGAEVEITVQPEAVAAARDLSEDQSPSAQEAQAFAAQVYGYSRRALGIVGQVLGMTVYIVLATVLTLASFAYFSWYFDELPSFKRFIPASSREEWWELLKKIELIFAGFLRGQLIVAFFTFIIFSVGFYLADVPYWFLVSLAGGIFSIIPYGQTSGWVLAMGAKYLESQADPQIQFTILAVLVWPTLVYVIMQATETLVITPWVQSWSTRMHPLAIFAAIVGGGSLGGILGMFLAIPVAASGKVVLTDVVGPRLRRWAEKN